MIMRSRFARLSGAFLLGVTAGLLLLEFVLRLLPVLSGALAADPDPAWPAHHLIPNAAYTFSAGWDLENVRRGRTNNMGYVAPFDYTAGAKGIVVIGDSFIESLMNDYGQTIQGSLPGILHVPEAIMNFGTSGAGLPHSLGIAGLVGKRFNPTWAVVLITEGNFAGGFVPAPGYYHWSSGPAAGIGLSPEEAKGPAKKVVRGLALVGYVRGNLRGDLNRLIRVGTGASTADCGSGALSDSDRSLVDYFAKELPRQLKLPASRVILIFDANRDRIYRGERIDRGTCASRDGQALELLARVAPDYGIHVIEMNPIFRDYYSKTRNRLDYSPTDYHWNDAAHILAAREIAKVINGQRFRRLRAWAALHAGTPNGDFVGNYASLIVPTRRARIRWNCVSRRDSALGRVYA
jgi:hypothetical protein